MKLKLSAGLALAGGLLFITTGTRMFADDHDKRTDVTITEPIEVPNGVILQPGTYMFRLMEITGNRHVVQIRSEDGKKTYAIAMVAAAYRNEPTSKVALTFWEMPAGQPPAIRKWFWPGDVDGQEFMYSHKRAAEISQLSKGEKVPEASEEDQTAATKAANTGSKDAAPAESTTTTADTSATITNSSANSAPVAAAPAPEPTPVQTTVAETTVTQTAPATSAPQPDQSQLLAQATPPAPPANPVPDQSASQNTSLPQTASDLPLTALIGGLSLAAALTVRSLRRV